MLKICLTVLSFIGISYFVHDLILRNILKNMLHSILFCQLDLMMKPPQNFWTT